MTSTPDPWRNVALILTRINAGPNGGSWYMLTLECGHRVTRPILQSPMDRLVSTGNLNISSVGAPKRVRCMWCGIGCDKQPVVYRPGVNAD